MTKHKIPFKLSNVIQTQIFFLQSLLFTRKLLMYSLGRSSGLFLFNASFPNCFSGYIALIAFGNELTATGIAPDFNGIPF